MPRASLAPLLFVITASAHAQNWPQWGANAQHDSSTTVVARAIDHIEQQVVIDPLADQIETLSGGFLIAHYPVPVIDGDDVVVLRKGGTLTAFATRDSQSWSVVGMRRVNGQLIDRWKYESDWKPVPWGSASWEPVYHPIVSGEFVWAPGAGGTIDQLDRNSGALIRRVNPFGTLDSTIFMSGPPAADANGNIYYNAIQFNLTGPWTIDPENSWLVRIGANGSMSKATFASLTPSAPRSSDLCLLTFSNDDLPWPPSRDAVPASARCGAQRPGINVAPAIAPDGTVYTISRAHFNSRYGYLVAVNADLTAKWTASMRNRLHDGCDVALPQSGLPGGCRAGSLRGVDPADNEPGSGNVSDTSSASPVVTPDGKILYGSYTRYNYAQGHLLMFDASGNFVAAYGWGWDVTPAIYRHGTTYSIILKENHYSLGSYCNNPTFCPPDRTETAPNDPEQFFIVQLDASLLPEWRFKNTNTESCERQTDGSLVCMSDHPHGFEWCVNAVAVDGRGVVYADSEDGNLYAIAQGGTLAQRLFLRVALGAAYTPTSIGPDGRVYTQNDGVMFVINQNPKRRAVRTR